MLMLIKKILAASILVLFITGIAYTGGIKESDLTSWENHYKMIQSFDTGNWGNHVLMTETSGVRIGTFNYYEKNVVDIFYPPDMDFNTPRPVLILIGLSDLETKKEMGIPYRYTGQALGWAQSAAELGFVVLAHSTGNSPKNDLVALVKWIRTKGKKYGLDGNRIGLWSSSNACDTAVRGLRPENNGFPKPSAIFAVFYYGNLTAYSGQDPEVPMFIVTAGMDSWVDIARIEKFISKMNEKGSSITHLHYTTGHHGFEVGEDTPETRNIIDQTFSFMLTNAE